MTPFASKERVRRERRLTPRAAVVLICIEPPSTLGSAPRGTPHMTLVQCINSCVA